MTPESITVRTPETITIENLGPIVRLDIPVPERGGGVVLCTGLNGSGKSTALAAVHALQGGDDDISVRDGADEGRVHGLSASLKFTRRRSAAGELVVASLESDLDPGLLIDPGIKDPESADMERVRVLCALAGVGADLSLFEPVLPTEFLQATAGPKARQARSLPEMTKWLKLDVERVALSLERAAEDERTKAAAMAATYGTVTEGEPHDEKILASERETAVRDLARAEGTAAAAAKRRATWESAQARLQALADARGGRTTVETKKAMEDAHAALGAALGERNAARTAEADAKVALDLETAKAASDSRECVATATSRYNDALREAKATFDKDIADADNAYQARVRAVDDRHKLAREAAVRLGTVARDAETALDAATREHRATVDAEAMLGGLRETVDQGAGEPGPTSEDLVAMKRAVDEARTREHRGAVVREALARQQEAVAIREKADKIAARAGAAREGASRVWGVVADAVARIAPAGLRFVDGRVRITTPDRGDELFAELSDGERGRVAIHACIQAVAARAASRNRRGLLTMAQHVWEGLDPANREYTRVEAERAGVIVITAEATAGDLRAAPFA